MKELLKWLEAEALGLDREQATSNDNNLRREGMATAVQAVFNKITSLEAEANTEELSVEQEALSETDGTDV